MLAAHISIYSKQQLDLEMRRHRVLPALGLAFDFKALMLSASFTQHLAWYRQIKPPKSFAII